MITSTSNSTPRSLILTAGLFLVAFAVLTPYFQTNDDSVMSLIAQGGWKEAVRPSEFLIYINIVTGLALKSLYSTFPGGRWYGLFLLTAFFVGTWGALAALLAVRRNLMQQALLLGVFTLSLAQFFSHVQFTTVTFWVAQAGLLLACSTDPRKRSWPALTAAGALLCLSSLIRFDGMALMLVAAVPLLLHMFGAASREERARHLRVGVIVSLAILGLFFFDRQYYQNRAEWSEVRPDLAALNNVTEYRPLVDDPDAPSRLATAGWTMLEFKLLSYGMGQAPGSSEQSVRALDQSLARTFSAHHLDWQVLLGDRFVKIQWLCVLVTCLFLPRGARRFAVANILWIALILFYLLYFKKIVPWVIWPLSSYLSLVCLLDPFPTREQSHSGLPPAGLVWARRLTVGLLAVAAAYHLRTVWFENREKQRVEPIMASDLKALAPRNDRLYLVSTREGAFPVEAVSVLGNYDQLNRFPVYRLSWEQSTPPERELLQRFRVGNIFTDVAGRDDILVISPPMFRTLYAQYAWERYHTRVDFRLESHGTLFDAYRVVKQGPSTP